MVTINIIFCIMALLGKIFPFFYNFLFIQGVRIIVIAILNLRSEKIVLRKTIESSSICLVYKESKVLINFVIFANFGFEIDTLTTSLTMTGITND